jgi:hypothetical protein
MTKTSNIFIEKSESKKVFYVNFDISCYCNYFILSICQSTLFTDSRSKQSNRFSLQVKSTSDIIKNGIFDFDI